MFGNLVNNRQFNDLVKSKIVEIEPFDSEKLGLVHYTLTVQKIKRKQPNGGLKTVYDFNEENNPFSLDANG